MQIIELNGDFNLWSISINCNELLKENQKCSSLFSSSDTFCTILEFYLSKNEYDLLITEEKINISFTFDAPALGINKMPICISPD